jgi:hypothetical protein
MGPERVPSSQQQAVLLEDRQTIQQHPQVSGRQPVQAHREAGVMSCRSHSGRACGPSSRRNLGRLVEWTDVGAKLALAGSPAPIWEEPPDRAGSGLLNMRSAGPGITRVTG